MRPRACAAASNPGSWVNLPMSISATKTPNIARVALDCFASLAMTASNLIGICSNSRASTTVSTSTPFLSAASPPSRACSPGCFKRPELLQRPGRSAWRCPYSPRDCSGNVASTPACRTTLKAMSLKDHIDGGRELWGVAEAPELKLRAIREAIDAHACEPKFCARSVADLLGLSERYVRKLLRADGESFSRARMRARLDRAHALLTDASCAALSVTEVSLAAGFTDISYFYRNFRQRFRVTPRTLRAQNRNGD